MAGDDYTASPHKSKIIKEPPRPPIKCLSKTSIHGKTIEFLVTEASQILDPRKPLTNSQNHQEPVEMACGRAVRAAVLRGFAVAVSRPPPPAAGYNMQAQL